MMTSDPQDGVERRREAHVQDAGGEGIRTEGPADCNGGRAACGGGSTAGSLEYRLRSQIFDKAGCMDEA